ncbi:MAG: hypothetical protein ACJ72E_01705 [Marmoricola sp.]
MFHTNLARRRTRVMAAGLVAGLLAAPLALGSPANAVQPAGSRVAVLIENGKTTPNDITFDPANANASGWWGHEGGANNGTGTNQTFLSMDGSGTAGTTDQKVAALMAAMGTDDISKIGFVIVPTSADGSNEDPSVTAGQNVGEVFSNGWILDDGGLGVGLSGTAQPNDSVAMVSTLTQIQNWVGAGKPLQGFDSSLQLHDVSAPGQPVSTNPKGTSILNTWAAGTDLSLVAYVTNGTDPDLQNVIPLVASSSGKAETAWLQFTTVAKPGDALRTSAGYQVVGAYAPTVAVTASYSGSTATLTATVKNKLGGTATDATGSIDFAQFVGGVDQTPTSVAITAGTGQAKLDIPGFTSGSRTYHVSYSPDVAAQGTYLPSGQATITIASTTTSLSAVGGATDTMTATVSPKVAGKVVFKDNNVTIGTVNAVNGVAKYAKKLAYGKHVLTAIFTPTNTSYKPSTASATRYQGKIATVLTPKKGRHGVRPKVTVKITAGVVATGKVTIVFDPPTGPTKKFVVTLKNGAATLLLPKTVKGKTKVTALYGGGSVLAINGVPVVFTAT